jgi:dihydrofolate reductase
MDVKCSVFIATSLDGFIARSDGGIDWLENPLDTIAGEDYGYQAFFASVDALLMGRKSYEKVLTFGSWPYPEKKVFVLSSGSPKVPEHLAGQVETMSGTPAEVLERLAYAGIRHIYVDGGKTIQGFLQAGLINEMTITQIPVLIGNGLPLFGSLDHDVRLQHLETKAYPNGFVQNKYSII